MGKNKIMVSSKAGNGVKSGVIIIKSNHCVREVKAVVFSSSEAKILDSYIDKMKM